jgi:hypothetical protein
MYFDFHTIPHLNANERPEYNIYLAPSGGENVKNKTNGAQEEPIKRNGLAAVIKLVHHYKV